MFGKRFRTYPVKNSARERKIKMSDREQRAETIIDELVSISRLEVFSNMGLKCKDHREF